ncbi:HAD domain-containing protein [Niveibacterium sp. 24ML]|uniref:HAD domain-containing protein n=1 Tax=Niveibacterium sp. 24ML TaxID=2985512 RepID=UPI0022721FF2|nr:HAD domain-containing protein [Niveibacterium sp. 24ML]MCX9158613.1 HAD domain-containing protein [Niveibacterium sp. 24ML]
MILFLDYDGVLHPLNKKEAKFCRTDLLDAFLVEHPRIEVVLSTSWRQIFPLPALLDMLPSTIAERVIGTTPIFPSAAHEQPAGVREHECRTWLSRNGRGDAIWLALDDNPALFATPERVVLCDPLVGLTPETIDELRQRYRDDRVSEGYGIHF